MKFRFAFPLCLLCGLTLGGTVQDRPPAQNESALPQLESGSDPITYAERALSMRAIVDQLRPHWYAPRGDGAAEMSTRLRWQLAENGSLIGQPEVVRQSGVTDSNRRFAQMHADRAIRAVELAAPFALPAEQYEIWREVTVVFDQRIS